MIGYTLRFEPMEICLHQRTPQAAFLILGKHRQAMYADCAALRFVPELGIGILPCRNGHIVVRHSCVGCHGGYNVTQ